MKKDSIIIILREMGMGDFMDWLGSEEREHDGLLPILREWFDRVDLTLFCFQGWTWD